MAGDSPIPENPLVGTEGFENPDGISALKQPIVTPVEPKTQKVPGAPEVPATVEMDSTISTAEEPAEDASAIPDEETGMIVAFWDSIEEEAERIRKEDEENMVTNFWDSVDLFDERVKEEAAIAAARIVPLSEVVAQAAAAMQELQNEHIRILEATMAAREELVNSPPKKPVNIAAPPSYPVVFRKTCKTCTERDWSEKCQAMYCMACGCQFKTILSNLYNKEEERAKIQEEERPACNPGEYDGAYCKECLINWFDNAIAWPHREPLPKMDGNPMIDIVKPFVSEAYWDRLMAIDAYWEDKEKLFCPVPSCSTYIPRNLYITKREVEVPKKKKEEVEEAKPEETQETQTMQENPEVAQEAAPEATLEAEVVAEPTVEAPTTETEEAKKEDEAVTTNAPTEVEKVEKEFKSQLVICPSPACRAPVCTVCKCDFHGLDMTCAARTEFYKSFMLSKFANPDEGSENGEDDDEDDDQSDYDEYEEFPNRFRQCMNCQNLVARNTGCDHMTCACGFAFCFACGGAYDDCHECIDEDEYLEGERVGGIKITNDDGFLDTDGLAVAMTMHKILPQEEDREKIAVHLEIACAFFDKENKMKTAWRVKPGVELPKLKKVMDGLTSEEQERLKTTTRWRGSEYY